MSGIWRMMVTVVINGRIVRHPGMVVIIMRVSIMMVNVMVMPEQGVMMMIDAVPIKTLRKIRSGYEAIHRLSHIG